MASFQPWGRCFDVHEMRDKIDRRAAAAKPSCKLGSARSTRKMQEIEREAMDMQLQDNTDFTY